MITLPPTFRFEVPAIAFRIPDLEAVAQLILRRVENNKVAGTFLPSPALTV